MTPDDAASAAWVRARRRVAGPILFFAVACCLFAFAARLAMTIPAQTDLSYPEGAVVARALDAARGGAAYRDWREWPHQFAPYAPLHYYPAAWLARFGPGPPTALAVYFAGRSIAFLSLLGIGLLMAAWGARLGLSPAWRVVAIGIALHWTSLLQYAVSFRPDAAAMFCALAGCLLVARSGDPRRRAALALIALMASMWIKPAAWGAVVFVAVCLRRSMGAKSAAFWLCAWVALGLGAAWMLDRRWHGALFLNMIVSLDNGLSLRSLTEALANQGRAPLMLLAGGIALALAGLRRAVATPGRDLALLHLLLVATTLLQSLKFGADKNYYLGPLLTSSLLLGDAIARLWRGDFPLRPQMREMILWLGVIPYAAVQSLVFFFAGGTPFEGVVDKWRPNPVLSRLRELPGLTLAFTPAIGVVAREPAILDEVQYKNLVARGKLDPAPLLDRMRDGRVAWVVLQPRGDSQRTDVGYCEGFGPLLDKYYVLAEEGPDFVLYQRKSNE